MRIPSSSQKRYLGGADWCIAALNRGTRMTTGRSVSFYVAVRLNPSPDLDCVEAGFRSYCSQFPLLWGKPARCWCLAPYWKTPSTKHRSSVYVRRDAVEASAFEDMVPHIETIANNQSGLKNCRAALHLLSTSNGGVTMVFAFDHLLFDADGAENFIDLFFRYLNGEASEQEIRSAQPIIPARLDQWCSRFASGKRLNRWMISLNEEGAVTLPPPQQPFSQPFRFRTASFDESQSQYIISRASAASGYLMFMPYILATAASAFHPSFSRHSMPDANYVVAVSSKKTAGREPNGPHLFFNQLSFLNFCFPVSHGKSRDALSCLIRDQFIEQVREDIPAAIEDANLLMRILPAHWFWRFMAHIFGSRLSSFALTCLGEPSLHVTSVLGCPIQDHLHLPIIPSPPGIGVIMSRSGGRLHAVMSYLEGILPESEIDIIFNTFQDRLLEGYRDTA